MTLSKTLDKTYWHMTDEDGNIGSFGNPNAWTLLNKAWNKREKWMKSTKVLNIPMLGCLVQVSTQQGDNIAEAVTFVPGAYIAVVKGSEDAPMLLPMKSLNKGEDNV